MTLQGYLYKDSKKYIIRNDHAHEPAIWAWDISNGEVEDKLYTHKWPKFSKKTKRKAYIELFNLDFPPKTVYYNPYLK